MVVRRDGRKARELRPIEIVRGYTKFAPGSVLIKCGDTHILCTASFERWVPEWKKGQGTGWVTAEYDMLPGSTSTRRRRNRNRIDGRSQEIQRLIGRALRAVMDLEALGENTIIADCDVVQADGGTRTAAITGAYVALRDAVRFARSRDWIKTSPVTDLIAAASVGLVNGRVLLDLNYEEDVAAEVDMNVAMTGSGRFVEIQATAESGAFTQAEADRMLRVATRGIKELNDHQERALRRRLTRTTT